MTERRSFPAVTSPGGLREALLAAARTEFLARGFRDASLRRVASKAGCAVASVYVHFASKDDLFDAVAGPGEDAFWAFYDTLEERDIAIAEEDLSFERALEEERALTAELFEFIAAHSHDISLLMQHADGSSRAGFKERLLERFGSMHTRMLSDLPEGITAEVFRMFSLPFVDLLERLSSGGLDRQTALAQADLVARFSTAGWNALLDLWPKGEAIPRYPLPAPPPKTPLPRGETQ